MLAQDKAAQLINQYVGCVYRLRGNHIKTGVDCYGMIKIFYKDFFGVSIDFKRNNKNPIEINRKNLESLFCEVNKNDTFELGDVLTFLIPTQTDKRMFHAGVYVPHNKLLQCEQKVGVSVIRLYSYLHFQKLYKVFRLKEKNGSTQKPSD